MTAIRILVAAFSNFYKSRTHVKNSHFCLLNFNFKNYKNFKQ
uniref:Uncharacterized protein n=1 Tax=Myoviridae sp. ctkfK18 TaxID=2825165 RepID=A0A8S5VGR3_9CAUD|nr:MAG TPA: hypothetical protein [Myoviridae sp. ctkfK18]